MPRLLPGQDPKIDMINGLVSDARGSDDAISKEALRLLLETFHPMILRICDKWSKYFEDHGHVLKPFDTLVADAQYWFMWYTLNKYTPDGAATYNNFIKNHINQRIRYIFEEELKYASRHLFPDPDKNSNECDSHDMLDDVIYKYGKSHNNVDTMDDTLIDIQDTRTRGTLAAAILLLLEDRRHFTQREHDIFMGCVCNGVTYESMGRSLGISRPRVSQILARTKDKLMSRMNADNGIRRLVVKWLA